MLVDVGRDRNHETPAERFKFLSAQQIEIAPTTVEMMVAVILDGQHCFEIGHVEAVQFTPRRIEQWMLQHRLRQSGKNHQQAGARLLGGLGPDADQGSRPPGCHYSPSARPAVWRRNASGTPGAPRLRESPRIT